MNVGMDWLVILLVLELQIHTNEGLEVNQVKATVNENCTLYTTSQHASLKNKTMSDGNSSLSSTTSQLTAVGEFMCPPWYKTMEDGICEKGFNFKRILIYEQGTNQMWLQTFYCMTTSDENSVKRNDVIGSCIYSFGMYKTIYYPLPCDISKLNKYTCAGLNREGQLCGRCMKGFAPPVYSYVLNCVKCTDYHLNWLKYIGVAIGPLTIFCILIYTLHISATSAYLHGFIFFSQILTMPTILRIIVNDKGYKRASIGVRTSESLYISLISVWNLDIFRVFYKPFCIHPNMTVVQALALEYIIALYPLVLILITYGLVSLHSRNNRIIVTLWRPLRKYMKPFLLSLNIETSLIESFATLFYLSSLKMQSVSLDLLSPVALYHPDGSVDGKLYLYLAGDVEYFGPEHMPYAVISLLISIVFLIIPGLLLFLYPCHCFQRFLNATHCNFHGLRIFMDVFQGHYKDGTNNTRDYRFFSGIFFWTRYVQMASFSLLKSHYSFLAFGIIITLLGFIIAIVHPHRKKLHYTLDLISLILLLLLLFSAMGSAFGPHNSIPHKASRLLGCVAVTLPILYITLLTCYWIFKKRVPQKFVHVLFSKRTNSYEHQGLLNFAQ